MDCCVKGCFGISQPIRMHRHYKTFTHPFKPQYAFYDFNNMYPTSEHLAGFEIQLCCGVFAKTTLQLIISYIIQSIWPLPHSYCLRFSLSFRLQNEVTLIWNDTLTHCCSTESCVGACFNISKEMGFSEKLRTKPDIGIPIKFIDRIWKHHCC